jgi:hypothetical protein
LILKRSNRELFYTLFYELKGDDENVFSYFSLSSIIIANRKNTIYIQTQYKYYLLLSHPLKLILQENIYQNLFNSYKKKLKRYLLILPRAKETFLLFVRDINTIMNILVTG